jgi:hypothetical protein
MAAPEQVRLRESKDGVKQWKQWGPYLSERQWGTVREDYSPNGDAWNYFTHDQARWRAYRWGEDGIAGISDDKQRLCFALALWNGSDSILKERLFGLTNSEGNHGEDCKEYYFYLDNTPTHSYMKYLYKYPQAPFPYDELVETNHKRTRLEHEYELIDTGVFDKDKYFDVFVEYAKADAEEILVRITVENRGLEAASLHLLPTLWFRNTWSHDEEEPKPELRALKGRPSIISAQHDALGQFFLHSDGDTSLLFTNNETNEQLLSGKAGSTPYVKDGFHEYVVHGNKAAVNPEGFGTKAAAHYQVTVGGQQSSVIRLRLSRSQTIAGGGFGAEFDEVFTDRMKEADEFYQPLIPAGSSEEDCRIIRQALAGMLWTKQFYNFDLDLWLREHGYNATGAKRNQNMRNAPWFHMVNADVISMPDKWEYPWYAAWDLAFHTAALAMVDVDFAKNQLELMVSESYLHPNGQLPAYEWNFGDVNPPVHAWATLYVYLTEKSIRKEGDLEFLKSCFRKLLLNFTWWVNRKDRSGHNIFEGGFLGLDNIGVFDRSAALPDGGYLEQADGTAWMAMFCQSMLSIALELAAHDPGYEQIADKFLEHFLWIAGAMDPAGDNSNELWDEQDGFFYDVLYMPDGSACRLRLKSMVGLLPLCAVSIIPPELIERYPRLLKRVQNFFERRPELAANLHDPEVPGAQGRLLLSVLNQDNLRRVLRRMLDENQFLGKHGIRALSKEYKNSPYRFTMNGQEYRVEYEPAESSTGLFGGNSNWRGPVWMPVNALIVKALLLLYQYYGDSFKMECPTGSGVQKNLFEIAHDISDRLANIFREDKDGRRPVFGDTEKFQTDPHWRNHLLFYEYFHGDNGAGIGASHQTGWTGLVARFIQLFDSVTASEVLAEGTSSLIDTPLVAATETHVAGEDAAAAIPVSK